MKSKTAYRATTAALILVLSALALPVHVQAGPTDNLLYAGGPVIKAPKVYLVFWGSEWLNPEPPGQHEHADLIQFFSHVGGSPWAATLSQYCDNAHDCTGCPGPLPQCITNPTGILAGTWDDTANPAPADHFDPDPPGRTESPLLEAEVQNAINHWGGTPDPNGIYFIAMPHGHNPWFFPAHGGADHRSRVGGTVWAPYVRFPYIHDAFGDPPSQAAGHEYAEAVTDPFAQDARGAWSDPVPGPLPGNPQNGEIGDKCSGGDMDVDLTGVIMHVQPLWSNLARERGCILGLGPAADFSWGIASDDHACLGSKIVFKDTSMPATLPLSTHTWQIFDSATGVTTTYGPESTSVQHAAPGSPYTTIRTLTVTTTVVDSGGASTSTSKTIPVIACPQTWASGDIINGKMIVVGNDPGCQTGPNDSQSTEPADTVESYWLAAGGPTTGLAPIPSPRFLSGASAIGSSLVVTGGADSCNLSPMSTTQIYSGAGWSAGGGLSRARIAPAAATVAGTMYVAGGDITGGNPLLRSPQHVPTATVEKSSSGSSWAYLNEPMPAGVIGASATANGNNLVVSGGFSHPQETNRLVQTYNLGTSRWEGDHLSQPLSDFGLGACGQLSTDPQRLLVGGMQGEDVPMYRFNSWQASNQVLIPTLASGGYYTWGAYASLPLPTAYAQVTTYGQWVYLQGGLTPPTAYGTPMPASDQVVRISCPGALIPDGGTCVSVAPPRPLRPTDVCVQVLQPPGPLKAKIADGAMEPAGCIGIAGLSTSSGSVNCDAGKLLMIFGGTKAADQVGTTLAYEPSCPNDHVYAMDPVLGNVVDLTDVSNGQVTPPPPAILQLPLPLAAMGSAHLADGRVVLLGGRTIDTATGNCVKPSDRVVIYDPTHLNLPLGPQSPFSDGVPLPKGLIAPSVAVVGSVVFVTGGDDKGDLGDPSDGWDPGVLKPTDPLGRHPQAQTWAFDFNSPCPSPSWIPLGDAPMGVVHGRLSILNGNDAWLIGGNHHPQAAVRLVQEGSTSHTQCGGTLQWTDSMLPSRLAFHDLESCQSGSWLLAGGIKDGTVYHSEPGATTMTNAISRYSLGSWTSVSTTGAPFAYSAGAIGSATNPVTDAMTGTTLGPDKQRTSIDHGLCP